MSRRTLMFDQIEGYKDEAEAPDAMKRLADRCTLIDNALLRLDGVACAKTRVTKNHFPAPVECYDLRVRFLVNKADRRTTWNKIYETVNAIKPAYYSFM